MTAADLLFTARWHSGLTQAEVAERAGTSQQTLMRYETGKTQPTLPVLTRLLSACGMRLTTALTPASRWEDATICKLLAEPPLQRLPDPYREAVAAAIPALRRFGISAVLADKAAARLHGAPVRVPFCEFWIDGASVRFEELEAMLTSAGGCSYYRFEHEREDPDDPRPDAVERLWSNLLGADVRFRAVNDFEAVRARALTLLGSELLVTAPADTARRWHLKHEDHLLLQRALFLRETRGPRALA
jgi:transcriptional regulator with XRE-family HTH domain